MQSPIYQKERRVVSVSPTERGECVLGHRVRLVVAVEVRVTVEHHARIELVEQLFFVLY